MTDEVHAYLGSLETVCHRQVFFYPNGNVLTLPLLYLPDIILFPGDDVPLRIFSDSLLFRSIQRLLSNDEALLAVLPPHEQHGVTVRVERFSVEGQGVAMTGSAMQHFRLIKRVQDDVRAGHFPLWGEVEILAQVRAQAIPFDDLGWKWRVEQDDHCKDKYKTNLCKLRGRQFPAYWGYATYALYDARVLVKKIQNMLLSNIHGEWFYKPCEERPSAHESDRQALLVHYLALSSDQQDPNLFALWVARNLPLDTAQRLELARIDSTVRLLRREIDLLDQAQEDIFCRLCGSFLANTRQIFSMTANGAAGGTYVNPGGHVYQVLTLRDVDRAHVLVDMVQYRNNTWFAGCAWNITYCNSCNQHLGWHYIREVFSPRVPFTFFAFRRAALTQSRRLREAGDPRPVDLN